MRNRGQLILGGFLLFLGLVSLLSVLFNIDFGAFCWPIGLILVGVWLLVRPRFTRSEGATFIRPIGDLQRRGTWQVSDQELWLIIGDTNLDFTEAIIPMGETTLRVSGFVGSVDIRAPHSIGLSVSSTSFVTDSKLWGEKRDYFLSPFTRTSEAYETAERKINIEIMYFVVDLRAEQV
jgi:predicted membrane protein